METSLARTESNVMQQVSWVSRGVDKRAADLHDEYITKARSADQVYGGVEQGTVGPVETKLLSFGEVKGLVFGHFGECSESTHSLMSAIATSRVRVAGPQAGRKGVMRTEEGEKSVVMSYIRKRISVASVKAQCFSLLGRLEALGPGVAAARGRRREAIDLDKRYRRAARAAILSERQGWNIHRAGFAKLD